MAKRLNRFSELEADPDEMFEEQQLLEELQSRIRELTQRKAALEKENERLRAGLSAAEKAHRGNGTGPNAETELKRTNEYLENVFENSPDAIGIVDRHGNLIKWNKMAAELYGYTFEELRGKSSFDLYADREELDRMLTLLRIAGTVKKYEINMRRKDGSTAPSRISISLLRDDANQVIGSVCVARDFTPVMKAISRVQKEMWLRRETEAALRESENLNLESETRCRRLSDEFQVFLDAIPDELTLLTPDLRIYWVNRAFALRCGRREADSTSLLGEYCYSVLQKRTAPCEGCAALKAFRDGEVACDPVPARDGLACHVRSVPVRDEDGKVTYVINITRESLG